MKVRRARHSMELSKSKGGMKALAILAVAAVALLVAGCGAAERAQRVPDVRGDRLDAARAELDRLGLEHRTTGGGVVGVVVASRWWVCDQRPRPGARDTSVLLVAWRACRVPDVRGLLLSEAKNALEEWPLDVDAVGTEDERPIVADAWTVCDQSPPPGRPANRVVLTVSRLYD